MLSTISRFFEQLAQLRMLLHLLFIFLVIERSSSYAIKSCYVRNVLSISNHKLLSPTVRKASENFDERRKLVIWDCDGVLVDSEALLKQGEVEALARAGFNLSVDDCVRLFSGVSPDKAEENFFNEMKKPIPANFFKEQIEGSMDLFRRRLQSLMKDTVQTLHERGVSMCVASGRFSGLISSEV